MKLKILKDEAHEIEFVLEDNRHTYPSLLRSRLLQDESVSFVAYKLAHPLDSSAQFILKTKGKTAKKTLETAVKQIDSELEEIKKTVEKKL